MSEIIAQLRRDLAIEAHTYFTLSRRECQQLIRDWDKAVSPIDPPTDEEPYRGPPR